MRLGRNLRESQLRDSRGALTTIARSVRVAPGGIVTFNCGPKPVTIVMRRTASVVKTRRLVVLDGGGLIPQGRGTQPAGEPPDGMARRAGGRAPARRVREWVYEHAEELGASRIGTGPRPGLRFPPQVLNFPGGNPTSPQAATEPANPRGQSSGLIPIHGA